MDDEGHLDEDTRRWIQDQADRYYGGNWGRAAAAILEAAYQAEQSPHDPWAGLDARLRGRAKDPS